MKETKMESIIEGNQPNKSSIVDIIHSYIIKNSEKNSKEQFVLHDAADMSHAQQENRQVLESSKKHNFCIIQNPKRIEIVKILPCVLCVDGGNAVLFADETTRIEYIQIVGIAVADGKKMQTQKSIYIVHIKQSDNNANHTIEIINTQTQEVTVLNIKDSKEKIASRIRRMLELKHAAQWIEQKDQFSTVLMDGSLEVKEECEEEKREMKHLVDTVNKKESLLLGLCKQTSLICQHGESLTAYASGVLKERSYIEAGTYINELSQTQTSEMKCSIVMVKLHEKSSFVFRCDMLEKVGATAQRVLGQLAAMSNDPTFLGYPYGLIKADMLARVANAFSQQFQEYIHIYKRTSSNKMQQNIKMQKEASVPRVLQAAHDKLDTMKF